MIFSEENEFVYGFERQFAALVLELDFLVSQNFPKKDIFKKFNNISIEYLEKIHSLVSCSEKVKKELYSQKLNTGNYTVDSKSRLSYVIHETTFLINYTDELLYHTIHPVLSHLQDSNITNHKISIDFIQDEHFNWQIIFNNIKIVKPIHITEITLILQDMMLITSYQSTNYLIALHAATLEFHNHIFIFPAISGSGKTTLSAGLMKNNFTLYSDELSVFDLNGNLLNLPFALSIKEGSWNILEKDYPILSTTDYHIRFDKQKVKFLKPIKKTFDSAKTVCIIFPKYTKGVQSKLISLNACQTMSRIKEAGYELNQALNLDNFEKILDYLLSRPAFSLNYSSLEEAIQIIKKLPDEYC